MTAMMVMKFFVATKILWFLTLLELRPKGYRLSFINEIIL